MIIYINKEGLVATHHTFWHYLGQYVGPIFFGENDPK